MDIRVMENYLAVVREGNISAAAQALHVSQAATVIWKKYESFTPAVNLFLNCLKQENVSG